MDKLSRTGHICSDPCPGFAGLDEQDHHEYVDYSSLARVRKVERPVESSHGIAQAAVTLNEELDKEERLMVASQGAVNIPPLSEWHGITIDNEGRVAAIAVTEENSLGGDVRTPCADLFALSSRRLPWRRAWVELVCIFRRVASAITTIRACI